MVAENFNVVRDSSTMCGWKIESVNNSDVVFDMPENVYNSFAGKYINADELLARVNTIRVAIAGCTDSFRTVNATALERNSVLKTFTIRPGVSAIDDSIDFCIDVPDADDIIGAAAKEYEKFHLIKMERDIEGNDNSIHAYVQTPKDGKLRCQFPKDVRLDAKRNNIKFWADDYRVDAGTNGGKFVRVLSYKEI